MAERIVFQEWHAANQTTNFPFAAEATLTNGQQTIVQGSILDAILYPIGASVGLFLSSITISNATITFTVGNSSELNLASGSVSIINPEGSVDLFDVYGRPAGLLVSDSLAISAFSSWGMGTFKFNITQTEFVSSVVVPTPEIGVRGVQLPNGQVVTGDLYLMGDDGVVLTASKLQSGTGSSYDVIRVDVVGDPLFQRRLCTPESLFTTPQFLQNIVFKTEALRVKCGPNKHGDVKMTANNNLAVDTALRIRPTPAGNTVEVAGGTL